MTSWACRAAPGCRARNDGRRVGAATVLAIAAVLAALIAVPLAGDSDAAAPIDKGDVYVYGYTIALALKSPDQVETVTYDFGDGSAPETVTLSEDNPTGLSGDHTYAAKGDYTVTVTMRNTYTDQEGVKRDGETVWTYTYHLMGYPVVSFDLNGAEGSIEPIQGVRSSYVVSPEDVPDDPVREGYSFDGWFLDADLTQGWSWDDTVSRHITLHAGWTLDVFTVTFDLNGGTGDIAPLTVGYGSQAVRPEDPSREGCVFTGWLSGSDLYDWSAPVKGNVHLVAGWADAVCTVTFDLNGGEGEFAPIAVDYGQRAVRPEAEPAMGSFSFTGWYTDRGCTQPYDWNAPVTGSITLYAGWSGEWAGTDDGEDGVSMLAVVLAAAGLVLAIIGLMYSPYLIAVGLLALAAGALGILGIIGI